MIANHTHHRDLGFQFSRENGKCNCFPGIPEEMDGWPAMETDAGRAMMKTPVTSATTFVYSCAADASDTTFYFQGC